ncbi:unnamed protein product [Knipowitschia caucasica]|uniref:Uncharacterized protein n=1 Tax=Knipowitschia caucasica TaxID=637954 RepID=A0AAV2MDC9_KNICA
MASNMELAIDALEELPLRSRRRGEGERVYQALELVPDREGPMHKLIQKQPAVLGSLQVVSGLLSVGVGIMVAVTQDIDSSLLSLFRVPYTTGALFFMAGLVSSMLFKGPELIPISLAMNCGCLLVAFVTAPLIIVDLSRWDQNSEEYSKMEVFELCILVLESILSIVLCVWFIKEKRTFSP